MSFQKPERMFPPAGLPVLSSMASIAFDTASKRGMSPLDGDRSRRSTNPWMFVSIVFQSENHSQIMHSS